MESLVKSSFYNGINIDYEILSNDFSLIEAGKAAGYDFRFSRRPIPNVENNTIIDSEFDAGYSESKKVYYLLAGISGLITGAVSLVYGNKISIDKGADALKQIWIRIAKMGGCKVPRGADSGRAYEMACAYLKNLMREKRMEPSNPAAMASFPGLALLILSQFCGKNIFIANDGSAASTPFTENENSLKSPQEKVLYALIVWFIQILIAVSKEDEMSRMIEKNIPKQLYDFIKDLSKTRIVSDIIKNYQTEIFPLALLLLNCVKKHTEMDLPGTDFLKNQAIPVIANECVVRAGYMFIRLYAENRRGNIKSLGDLKSKSLESIAPKDNRTLIRMLTISSGTFVAVSTAGAAIRALAESKGNKFAFIGTFAVNINYAGIARFVFALRTDMEYIKEDFENLVKRMRLQAEQYNRVAGKLSESFKCLTLDADQTRILYSLEWQKIYYDILHTDDTATKIRKIEWHNEWEQSTVKALGETPYYFIRNEDTLYKLLEEKVYGTDKRWLLLISLELQMFTPYEPLNNGDPKTSEKQNKKYKGLKYKASYGHEIFCLRQSAVGIKQYEDVRKSQEKYYKQLNGNLPAAAIGIAAIAVVTIATGGAALALAPSIAVPLAGTAVAGLHGAALTSASLAIVGGGALAVGGLGVAGGTAIITGGGALLGAVISGASVATVSFFASKGNLLRECSKLLAYSRVVLLNYCHDVSSVAEIRKLLDSDLAELEDDITAMEETETDKNVKKRNIQQQEQSEVYQGYNR